VTEMLPVLAASALALGTPLLLAALGELVSERAGVLNIGVEGLMLTGAFAGFLGCWMTGSPLVGLACAGGSAMLLGILLAAWVVGLDADQVVAGAALNILALGLTGTAYRAVFGVTGAALTVPTFQPLAVGDGAWLAPFRQPAPVYFALALVPLLWVVLARTRLGLALRAVGEAPEAAASLGVPVVAIRVGARSRRCSRGSAVGTYPSPTPTRSSKACPQDAASSRSRSSCSGAGARSAFSPARSSSGPRARDSFTCKRPASRYRTICC
jgi:ABC-type uncharacterized transport system permease subunit